MTDPEMAGRNREVFEMIWAALALLGVPIWLVLGALIGALISRRRFQQQPDVFPLRIQTGSTADKWSTKDHARWIHDVLLVNTGLALARTRAYAIAEIRIPPATPATRSIKKLGDDPVILALVLDDGTTAQIATPREELHLAMGPLAEDQDEEVLD